ncbi:Sulfotransferase, partial [hydrothermal vent metagenome]
YGAALEKSGKKYFLDKTPRYFFIVPDLYRLFPEARFIFLKRNPLSILSSILSTYVKIKWAAIGFYRPDLLDAPSKILDGISLLGDKAIDLKYEDFVENPEKCCKMLCEYIGVPFVDGMVDYGDTTAPKGYMNDPVGIHKYSRPSKASLDKWKQLAENRQHSYFATRYLENLGEGTLTKLGYSYNELYRIVNTSQQHKGLYSWELAMKTKDDWTIKDRFISHRYYLVADKGKLLGTLTVIYRELIKNLRKLKKQII